MGNETYVRPCLGSVPCLRCEAPRCRAGNWSVQLDGESAQCVPCALALGHHRWFNAHRCIGLELKWTIATLRRQLSNWGRFLLNPPQARRFWFVEQEILAESSGSESLFGPENKSLAPSLIFLCSSSITIRQNWIENLTCYLIILFYTWFMIFL